MNKCKILKSVNFIFNNQFSLHDIWGKMSLIEQSSAYMSVQRQVCQAYERKTLYR